MAPARGCSRATFLDRLPPELLAEIHGRLGFVDRLALAASCAARSRLALKPEAPCLVLPGAFADRITVFSLADHHAAAARATDPAMRDHVVLGSSSSTAAGWLVTADAQGDLRMANPVTGEQADLPAITTIPFIRPLGGAFCLCMGPFADVRFRGEAPSADGTFDGAWWGGRATFTHTADQMRLWFYRKVVFSVSASPTPSPRGYAAMLILSRNLGAPAFATAEDPVWRLAPSRDGVEDAIHHDGRFYSVTYSGAVEAWDRRGGGSGEFVSRAVAPRLAFQEHGLSRKYLAAAPDGRLMAVLKYSPQEKGDGVSFKVQVLDEARRRWKEASDIGDAALFVGVNATLCVAAREYHGVRAGCVYFTDDNIGETWLRHERRGAGNYGYGYANREANHEIRDVGVYSLQSGKTERINATLQEHPRWPPAAWFTPSV
ncbi:unnamed protein product [Urochloa decumbens]|uniref:KIB1-4 beta-propeller domain-containing protein n=1 Tax=Urochloa decumbens TaxID=240449 RepID=A0ABC8YGQ1_9POAL